MSNYRNYVEDFPTRCQRILQKAGPMAKREGLDVTLLLMASSTALTVPFERLRPEGTFVAPMSDRTRYQEAAAQLERLQRQPFLDSSLWNSVSPSSWASGTLASVSGAPDEWPELKSPAPMDHTVSVDIVLTTVRNALAHGNIYMLDGVRQEIRSIVFVKSSAKPNMPVRAGAFRYLQVTPADFRVFLDNWFAFLKDLALPGGIIIDVSEAA